MSHNTAREGGGAVLDVVDSGCGALTLDHSRVSHNISGEFQTAPGIFYELDGLDRVPVTIGSTGG